MSDPVVSGPAFETVPDVKALLVSAVRRDERLRVAARIEESAEIIARFAGDRKAAVQLVALMLRMDALAEPVADSGGAL